jgi:DNA repair exonuclease SbcCD ATPase subunit
VEELNRKVASLQETNKLLLQTIAKLKTEMSNLASENLLKEEQLKDLQSKTKNHSDHQTEIKRLKTENKQLRKQLGQTRSTPSSLSEDSKEITQLKEELNEKKTLIAELIQQNRFITTTLQEVM